jgi:hypothetical protein
MNPFGLCTLVFLAAFAYFIAKESLEAGHRSESALKAEHVHQDWDRSARVADVNNVAVPTTSSVPPPDESYLLLARIARRWARPWYTGARW